MQTPMPNIQPRDDVLLQRIALQDTRAFEFLYDRYSPTLYALIYRIVRDRSLADELLQETFLHVWSHAQQFRGQGSPLAWFYRIARNKSLDALRWAKRDPAQQAAHFESIYQEMVAIANERYQKHKENTVSHAIEPESDSFVPIHLTAGRQASSLSFSDQSEHANDIPLLNGIPDEQRMCLELAFFGGMTQQQIAEHLHVSLSLVKSNIRMGVEKLQELTQSAPPSVSESTRKKSGWERRV